MTTRYARAIVSLAELALRFGRVERITFHPDGIRPETDTDHTVMLGLTACAFAVECNRRNHFGVNSLDIGKIAQFALVHDLVEAYAGDTPTLLHMADDEKDAKTAREQQALRRIAMEMADLPWVGSTLAMYENQVSREARFVRAMDKLMPKACAILNDGATVRAQGITRPDLVARYDEQREELMVYAGEFEDLMALRDDLVAWMMDVLDDPNTGIVGMGDYFDCREEAS